MFNNCQHETTLVSPQDANAAKLDKNISNSNLQDKMVSASTVTPSQNTNDEPVSISSNTPKTKLLETGDGQTPSLAQGSGKIPESKP